MTDEKRNYEKPELGELHDNELEDVSGGRPRWENCMSGGWAEGCTGGTSTSGSCHEGWGAAGSCHYGGSADAGCSNGSGQQ